MPVTHLIKNDLLIFTVCDEVTTNEFYAAWDEIIADPAFQPPINTLVDLREAQVDIPSDEIQSLVDYLKANRLFNRMVLVAARGSFTYALGRMFCVNAENVGLGPEIFISMHEALAWLNRESVDDTFPAHIGLT